MCTREREGQCVFSPTEQVRCHSYVKVCDAKRSHKRCSRFGVRSIARARRYRRELRNNLGSDGTKSRYHYDTRSETPISPSSSLHLSGEEERKDLDFGEQEQPLGLCGIGVSTCLGVVSRGRITTPL